MALSKAKKQEQKIRLVIWIERGLKRALLQQSLVSGCSSRPDMGSMSEKAYQYICDGLRRDGINIAAIIKSGL
jgi:hypothetical protein